MNSNRPRFGRTIISITPAPSAFFEQDPERFAGLVVEVHAGKGVEQGDLKIGLIGWSNRAKRRLRAKPCQPTKAIFHFGIGVDLEPQLVDIEIVGFVLVKYKEGDMRNFLSRRSRLVRKDGRGGGLRSAVFNKTVGDEGPGLLEGLLLPFPGLCAIMSGRMTDLLFKEGTERADALEAHLVADLGYAELVAGKAFPGLSRVNNR